MKQNSKLLGLSKVVQDEDGFGKVQISSELDKDMPMYILFLAMNVEVVAHRLEITSEQVLELISKNIEVEPMTFNQEKNQ